LKNTSLIGRTAFDLKRKQSVARALLHGHYCTQVHDIVVVV
jgi:hypothetical protein